MSASDADIRILDAAYEPFPSFQKWTGSVVVDPVRWDRYKVALEAHSKGLSPEVLERARNVAKRAAALDTGAIEGLYEVDRGFTFTVALEAATWETLLAAKGENVRPLFEAQLHAYDYVLDLATNAEPISEAAIRILHEEVCKAQSTYKVTTDQGRQEQLLPKGQYKSQSNHVRTRKGANHSYAPVDETPAEMERFVKELRTPEFLNAHPVLQAAYAHYAFVVIHPFADGNGRVARALASIFTYRAVSIPIIILSEHRVAYLDALEDADGGMYQAFLNFMLARSLDTINLVDESIRSGLIPSAEKSVENFNKLYITKGGFSQDDVDKVGIQLLEGMIKAIAQEFTKYGHPKIKPNVHVASPTYPTSSVYRLPVIGGRALQIVLISAPPASAQLIRTYNLMLPKDAAGDDDILIEDPKTQDAFRARMDELLPVFSGMLQIHQNMFVERVVSEMLAELMAMAKKQIGR